MNITSLKSYFSKANIDSFKKIKKDKLRSKARAHILFVGRGETPLLAKDLGFEIPLWQQKKITPSVQRLTTSQGPLWLVHSLDGNLPHHEGYFSASAYEMARDLVGTVYREAKKFEHVLLEYRGTNEEELSGALVGVEMASYTFKQANSGESIKRSGLELLTPMMSSVVKPLKKASGLGRGINLTRHLVNLPGNMLNPKTYPQVLKAVFANLPVQVEVWSATRLKREGMGLHLAVGQSAEHAPCLVKLKYRPLKKKKHYAVIGKGITFDSGGLDIKPASGMREMKKDMGGSATASGLCYSIASLGVQKNIDFYLPIAENAMGGSAFRPGDILTSRDGKTVEIHNTDAEGRLVLADSLTLAAEQQPEALVNIATLTGAIKVGLGSQLAGFFSNADGLANKALKSTSAKGDRVWRMPLDPSQKSRLHSQVADLVNCTDGFGGAVTASLFLEHFTKGLPFLHFDIYAWTTSASGPLCEKGANGQLVQALTDFFEEL